MRSMVEQGACACEEAKEGNGHAKQPSIDSRDEIFLAVLALTVNIAASLA